MHVSIPKMYFIQKKLTEYCHKSNRLYKQLKLDQIWSIVIFTTDGDFCSQYQRDLRNQNYGCKWIQMQHCFTRALDVLSFAEHMVQQHFELGDVKLV